MRHFLRTVGAVSLTALLLASNGFQFVNYTGTITAFSFSPVVLGWTNGSQYNPNTGLRIRWDSASTAWVRE